MKVHVSKKSSKWYFLPIRRVLLSADAATFCRRRATGRSDPSAMSAEHAFFSCGQAPQCCVGGGSQIEEKWT